MYQSEMWAYRAHGDGDVEVLGSVVLLEGVDVEPHLKTHTIDSTILRESNLSMETKHKHGSETEKHENNGDV